MADAERTTLVWQLIALRKRLDTDPYGLSSDELMLLKSYEQTNSFITRDR